MSENYIITTRQQDNNADKIGRRSLGEQDDMTNRAPKIPSKDKMATTCEINDADIITTVEAPLVQADD